ncbi:hypothetical protein Naga_102259g1, partial [Nannochloropsis gaditana]
DISALCPGGEESVQSPFCPLRLGGVLPLPPSLPPTFPPSFPSSFSASAWTATLTLEEKRFTLSEPQPTMKAAKQAICELVLKEVVPEAYATYFPASVDGKDGREGGREGGEEGKTRTRAERRRVENGRVDEKQELGRRGGDGHVKSDGSWRPQYTPVPSEHENAGGKGR